MVKPASRLHAFSVDDLGRPPVEVTARRLQKHAPIAHIADLRDEMEAKARTAVYGDLELSSWYQVQLATVQAQVTDLEGKLMRNLDRLTGKDDPNWPKYWRQQARHAYLAQAMENRQLGRGTLPLLQDAGHVLVCPNHGIDGVSDLDPAHFEGLSLRGVLEGGLATHAHWQRYCLECADGSALKLLADYYHELWQGKRAS